MEYGDPSSTRAEDHRARLFTAIMHVLIISSKHVTSLSRPKRRRRVCDLAKNIETHAQRRMQIRGRRLREEAAALSLSPDAKSRKRGKCGKSF
jgi:transcription elongation GreA/GreB family factor